MKIALEELLEMELTEYGFFLERDKSYINPIEYYTLLKKAKRALPPMHEFYWITINPKPEASLQRFIALLNNFVKRKPVLDYVYNIEQRGETESDNGKGFHSHLLIKWVKAQNKYVKQFCVSTFKSVVGYPSEQIINIRRISPDIYNDKLAYLNGLKWDPDKDAKIVQDIIFRKKNNILELYKKHGDISQEDSNAPETAPSQEIARHEKGS